MIPMEYLTVEARYPSRLQPGGKSGESTNRNRFIKHKNSRSERKIEIGPAAVLCLGEETREYTLGYDRFAKPKKI
jgi:hypothetical protein